MHAYVSVCVWFVSFFSRLIFLQFKIGLLWSMSSVFRFRWKACCFVLFMIKSQVYLLYGLHIKVTIDYSKNTFFFLCSVLSPFCKLRIKAFNREVRKGGKHWVGQKEVRKENNFKIELPVQNTLTHFGLAWDKFSFLY